MPPAMLTTDEVRKISELCRIELTAAEIEKFQKELSVVLEYVSELNKVDTTGVEEISQVTGLENVNRPDVADLLHEGENLDQIKAKIIANFPESKDGFLKIKSIL